MSSCIQMQQIPMRKQKQTHKSFRESSQQEIWKHLSGEELGSQKPSEFLRNMKCRAESLNVEDKLMMELFLQRLPSSAQIILAAVSDLMLNKAVDIVDRLAISY
ncbi:retrovirus-related Pol polyprotein from transposon opus [Trichonephila clavipes]|nr:retrovirus-related Pol polyprotein from transposon opus [Trichonephila clavipes]